MAKKQTKKKRATAEKKRPIGRPEIDESAVNKLMDAFSWGCDVTSACLFAEISRQAYYNYCSRHPDFNDRCEALRNMPNLHARRTVFNAMMSGDVATAKWYLERKFKDEFATKQNIDSTNVHTGFQIVMAEGDDKL